MRILLDNCVSRKFARLIEGHEVVHARQMGWADLQNGELIAAADKYAFEVLITVDKGLQHQQSLSGRRISILTMAPRLVFYEHLAGMIDQLHEAFRDLSPGTFVRIEPK